MFNYFICLTSRGSSVIALILLLSFQPTIILADLSDKNEPEGIWLGSHWKNMEEIDITKTAVENRAKPDNYSLLCHRDNFDLFFALFSEDPDFQRHATIFPLKYSIYTPEEFKAQKDDPDKEVKYFIPSADKKMKVDIFPSRYQRLQEKLLYTYIGLCESDCKVGLTKDGTGVGILYIFEWNGCWFLREIDDHSN
ncbi:MAG: hypothetical protein LBP33_03810 [Candidatus Adiutrix sp.]|jgi:hypothetical protein|nr:hypothetical protein [Candidatus Adiutrix sp.]